MSAPWGNCALGQRVSWGQRDVRLSTLNPRASARSRRAGSQEDDIYTLAGLELGEERGLVERQRREGLVEVGRGAAADEHGGDAGPVHRPGEREVRHGMAGPGGDGGETGQPAFRSGLEVDGLVAGGDVEARTGLHAAAVLAGEEAGPEGAVGDDGHFPRDTKVAESGVDLAHGQVVDVLQRTEGREARLLLQREHRLQLGGGEIAHAQGAHPAGAHQPVQRAQGVRRLGGRIPLVQVEQVDRRHAEPGRAGGHGRVDGFRREGRIDLRRHRERSGGGPARGEPCADNLFGGPGRVGRGRVKQGDAAGHGVVHQGKSGGLVDLAPEG